MSNKKITIVYSEDHDWVGMYIDEVLTLEGHSLSGEQVLQALGLKYQVNHVTNEWAEEQGRFPDKEKDCEEGFMQ